MCRLIKMNLYRLFHSKSTWIILCVVMAMAIFCVKMTELDIDMMKEEPEQMEETTEVLHVEEEAVSINIGIFSETKSEWVEEKIEFPDFIEVQMCSGICMLILAIWVSVFVSAEYKNGFIKNIAGQVENRWLLVGSKLVAVATLNACMCFLFALTTYICGKIVFKDQFITGSFSELINILVGQYLLHLAFAVLIMAACIVFKSSEFSMTIGILISCRVAVLLYLVINKLWTNIFSVSDFDISKYAIESKIYTYSGTMSNDEMIKCGILAVVYICIFVACAGFVEERRDIK